MQEPKDELAQLRQRIADLEESERQRRHREAEMRLGDRRFTALFEQSAVSVALIDSYTGRFARVNQRYCDLLGYTADEMLRMDFQSITYPEDLQADLDNMARLRRGELAKFQMEKRLYRKGGSIIWVRLTVLPLWAEPAKPDFHLAIVEDITNAKRAEEELQRAKSFAENLIQTANVIFLQMDTAGNIVRVNEATERIIGYSEAELVGRNWFETVVPKDRFPFVWDEFGRFAQTGDIPRVFENPILTKAGEERYIVWQNSPIFEGDKPVGTISFGVDITERKQSEEERERLLQDVEHLASEAQRQTAELHAVLNNMVDAVYVCDADGRTTLQNSAGLQLAGVQSAEDATGTLAEMLDRFKVRHADGTAMQLEDLPQIRALAGDTVTLDDEIILNLSTKRDVYIRVNASPVRDEDGKIVGAVAVVRDVTELTELDHLKDQFISTTAHELKTPLTLMKGYAQVLLRTIGDTTPSVHLALLAIDRGADRINRIVTDLLDISRFQLGGFELKTENIDLPELIKLVLNRMALTVTKHRIEITQTAPVIVRGDRDHLEQVLEHLIDNAVRFSPGGGNIDVAVSSENDEAVVSVRDFGVGIPENKKAHIFERFYRAHAGSPYDFGGMGVGLYISREIITRHGGRMWFESEEGKGSTFYFSLPLA